MQGAEGRSPDTSPGKVDRPSKRRVRGLEAAKPQSDDGLGRCLT